MVLWPMIVAQMIVWAWFSVKGGKSGDRAFHVFTIGMLLGQIGAGIETYQSAAWRAFVIQIYFFFFTAFGGINRFRQTRKERRT